MQDGTSAGTARLAVAGSNVTEVGVAEVDVAESDLVTRHGRFRAVAYRDVVDEIHVDLGGRITHLWVETGGGWVSTLDLVGDGLTLFTGPGGTVETPATADGGAPVIVQELPAVTARALGIAPGGSLLVRPSGVPARTAAAVAVAAA